MITKFTDSDNNTCYMQYFEWDGKSPDHFRVWTEAYPTIKHTFLPEEVESFLDRGIWRHLS